MLIQDSETFLICVRRRLLVLGVKFEEPAWSARHCQG